jgi:uncharacterized paraquat-inducible protein A
MVLTVPLILLFLAVVFNTFRLSKEMREQRRLAIEKGVQPFAFDVFTIAVALHSLPFVAYFLFRLSTFQSLWFPLLVLLSYTPALLLADTIGDRIERGYDYHRRAAKTIKEAEAAGYVGLCFWLLSWVLFYFFLS